MLFTKAIRETVIERRKTDANWNGKIVPSSVVFLEDLLSSMHDSCDVDEVLAEISGEYARAEMYELQLDTVKRRAANLPDDLLVKIELARRLSYSGANSLVCANDAKNEIAKTVDLARKKNEWVRAALSEQAWIGIRLGDSRLFVNAIEALIQDVASKREFEVDSRLFPEITEEIPAGFCSPTLMENYRRAIINSRA